MITSSCKAKGRRLQQAVRDDILRVFPQLTERDVRSTSMGASGTDVQLSEAGVQCFPFSVECKNVEKLNIWGAIRQSRVNTSDEPVCPLVVFKRNGSRTYACVEWGAFLELVRDAR